MRSRANFRMNTSNYDPNKMINISHALLVNIQGDR
jgi:hypothetical protein